MRFALLRCCLNPSFCRQYELATNAVLPNLGIDVVNIREFNCCGYPLKSFDFMAYVLSSTRNLALAESKNLDILTLCGCCYGNVKHVEYLTKNDSSLKGKVNTILEKERLNYQGTTESRHLFQVMYHDIGLESLQRKVVKTYSNLKVAVHYGCHLLRPSEVVQFDKPFSPSIFDQLVEITGAKSIPWSTKLDCCGSAIAGVNDELSRALAEKKFRDAKRAGADCLCVICPYCYLQFGRVQKTLYSRGDSASQLPLLLYTQLLGLCLGIEAEALGLRMNEVPVGGIEEFLTEKAPGEVTRELINVSAKH